MSRCSIEPNSVHNSYRGASISLYSLMPREDGGRHDTAPISKQMGLTKTAISSLLSPVPILNFFHIAQHRQFKQVSHKHAHKKKYDDVNRLNSYIPSYPPINTEKKQTKKKPRQTNKQHPTNPPSMDRMQRQSLPVNQSVSQSNPEERKKLDTSPPKKKNPKSTQETYTLLIPSLLLSSP